MPFVEEGGAVETLLNLGLANALSATVLAILVAALARLLASRPAVLHCLWFLVLLKLLTPPLFEIPLLRHDAGVSVENRLPVSLDPLTAARPQESEVFVVEALADDGPATLALTSAPWAPGETEIDGASLPQVDWFSVLLPWLGLAWMSGTAATLALAALRILRFHRLLAAAQPACQELQEQTHELAARMGLKRTPRVFWIEARLTPMLWAVACRPRLIIPKELWQSLDQDQQSMLLVHELAHLKRGDHLLRLFELGVTALYWWMPVVWWARFALHDAEEQCCDAWVVWAFPKKARAYAETLLETVDFLHSSGSPEPLLASSFGKVHHLRRRLTMIMLGTTPRHLSRGSALGALALAAITLPLTPSWAQKPEEHVEEIVTIVRSDQDAGAKAVELTNAEVELVVTTDGKTDKIKADSLDKAIDEIKDRIKKALKDSAGSDEAAARVKALKQALENLEKSKGDLVLRARVRQDGDRKAEERKIIVRKLETAKQGKPTAEKKAQIDKAKARVEALRSEMMSIQKKLREAELDFMKIQGDSLGVLEYRPEVHTRVEPVQVRVRTREELSSTADSKAKKAAEHAAVAEVHRKQAAEHAAVAEQTKKLVLELQRKQAAEHAAVAEKLKKLHAETDASLKPSERERLNLLEKRMAELLEEVAKLKKQGK
jgi:beta-lactamase regulating signal transducer with metallopeptidase domain